MMPAPGIRDNAIAGGSESGLLIAPIQGAAAIGMNEHYRFARATSIPIPDAGAADIEPSFRSRRLGGRIAPACLRRQFPHCIRFLHETTLLSISVILQCACEYAR